VAAAATWEGPFWGEALDLAVALAEGAGGAPEAPALPPAPSPLDDPKAGLRTIARFLATPALAGALLTRSEIAGLGRRLDTPRGFGGRAQMIGALLTNAAEYGGVAAVAQGLDGLFAARIAAYEAGGPAAAAWAARAAATRSVLARLSAAAG